jgi:outer membrane immunogenic protein
MKCNIIRGLVVSALVIAAPLSVASAADMALKAAPPPPPIYDWTGFYLGLNGGYSWGKSSTDFTSTGPGFSTSQTMNGGLGGGQIGYNWGFKHNWLFGLEADIQGTGQRGSDPLAPVVVTNVLNFVPNTITTTTGNLTQKLPWFGTARARIGVLASPTWLLYATGGLAFGEVNTSANVSATTSTLGGIPITTAAASASSNNIRAGWTVGAGVEGVISGPWTAKLEYLYMDLGSFSNTFTGVGAYTTLGISSHVTDNILRVGLNYRFGGPY